MVKKTMIPVKSPHRKEIPLISHQLTRLETGRYYCSVCGKSWIKAPRSTCPGVTIYSYKSVPNHFKTERQLKQLGLKLAPHQRPVGVIIGTDRYYLYDQGQAIPRPARTSAQIAAFEKARAAALEARICTNCGRVFDSKREFYEGLCDECFIEVERKIARADAIAWACEVLADPQAVILDTETTGLIGQIIEIAIIDIAGQPLLNTLIKPGLTERNIWFRQNTLDFPSDEPIIPPQATAVHGISDADVADAPTFAEVYEQVREILHSASRIISYNAKLNQRMLRHSREIFHLPPFDLEDSKFECVMEVYAEYYGEWSYYYEDFKKQPLKGETTAPWVNAWRVCAASSEWLSPIRQSH